LQQSHNLEDYELNAIKNISKELAFAMNIFAQYKSVPKVSIFGSARIKPHEPAYKLTEEFSELMIKNGYQIITGGGPGIMEAGHKASTTSHGFGLSIKLPFEGGSNPFISGHEKNIVFKYFMTRKFMFLKESNALVCLPGGFGTMDEMFEMLTMIQTGKSPLIPIVLLSPSESRFWDNISLLADSFVKEGTISQSDRHLFLATHDIEEAKDEIVNFYKNYHSSRFWKKNFLLMRFKKRFSPKQINKLAKIVKDSGEIKQLNFQPYFEQNIPKYEGLNYLSLEFAPKKYGDVRLLINNANSF
jgi:uncharacterized protein (TIGR00730 family)